MKRKHELWVIWVYAILTLYFFYTIYPIFLMISTSLKQNKEIIQNPAGFPKDITFEGFIKLFEKENFGQFFLNSIFVTVVAGVILLIVSLLLAYALSRYINKISRFLFFFFLAGMMVPLRLGLLSLNDLLYKLNLIDNLWGIIFIYVAMGIPFTMFILTGFIRMIPITLEESAFIDGANTFTVLTRIIVPLIKPAIATVVIYNFVPMWNDVYFPLIFIKSVEKRMLMHAVTLFFGQFSTNWNLVFSALTVACIPVIVLYIFCSKYLIRGLMAGSLKG
jgi:raffinose/stachyose/melibiose transport system permease protein